MQKHHSDSSLEIISLDELPASFSRFHTKAVHYYHWHQCIEVLFIEEGYGVVSVDNKTFTAKPGRLFIFPPFKLHKINISDEENQLYKRTILHFEAADIIRRLERFPAHKNSIIAMNTVDSEACIYDFSDDVASMGFLLKNYERLLNQTQTASEHITSLILSLLDLLPVEQSTVQPMKKSLANDVIYWIDQNYMHKFHLDDLAKSLNYSASYVCKRFKSETGEQIHQFLLIRRIRQACELLRNTTNSIQDVALQVGFAEPTYFIKQFKSLIGVTPLQYRKKQSIL
ncbi:MAG: helix-turn-helix domain-containing protein [Vibrio sp.]